MKQINTEGFVKDNFKKMLQQSMHSKSIDLSYKSLVLPSQIFYDQGNHFESGQGFNYFKQIFSQMQKQINSLIQQQFLSVQMHQLIKQFIVIQEGINIWNKLIPHFASCCRFIVELQISSCLIGDEVMELIFKAEWKFLRKIDLQDNNISWRGIQYLAKCDWIYLKELQLEINFISNKGLSYLVKSKWPSLQSLRIAKNEITSDGFKYLTRSNWTNLRCLILSDFLGNEALKCATKVYNEKFILFSLNIYRKDDSRMFYNLKQLAKLNFQKQKHKAHAIAATYCYSSKTVTQNLLSFIDKNILKRNLRQ